MAIAFFWSSLVLGTLIALSSLFYDGTMKREIMLLPFLWLLAAAVAKYLGI